MAFTVDIRGNATHLEKTLKSVKGNLTDLGGTGVKAATAGLAAMGAAGAAALGAFVVTSSNAAASLEDLTVQFEVLTGSAKKAQELLKLFREEEKKSSLSTEDYANVTKELLANRVAYEDILPTVKMLGDVSMGNSEKFASLGRAFAQTTAAGRLMGTEVLQFINAGFNPLAQIAEDTGKSMADLKKEMEDGKISVQMVKQAFINATSAGGLFYKAIDKGSATTSAKINQTKAAVTQLQVAFGTGFNEGLKDALDATNNFLPQLEGKFAEAGAVIGSAITQAVQGNTDQLATIGAFAGEVFFAGFKAFYLKAFDELIAATQNKFGAGLTDPSGAMGAVERVNQAMGTANGVPIQSESASLASYLREAIENVQNSQAAQSIQQAAIANGIAEGLRKGEITEGMREEVKQGILDAWSKDPNAGRARFSN
jgi:tape measure domain-containing protein